jgi:hypothetical protein
MPAAIASWLVAGMLTAMLAGIATAISSRAADLPRPGARAGPGSKGTSGYVPAQQARLVGRRSID